MRQPHDQTAEMLYGIDIRRIGLPCRFSLCNRTFVLASQSSASALSASAALRDAHEIADHGYHHVVEAAPGPVSRFSKEGRSLLGRKRS